MKRVHVQLDYLKSKLTREWTHLERQRGGLGLRGPGETQLETDRRLLGIRMKQLISRLKKIKSVEKQIHLTDKKNNSHFHVF